MDSHPRPMTGVTLDTSGSVATYPWEGGEIAPQVRWDQLSPFEQGYVEKALDDFLIYVHRDDSLHIKEVRPSRFSDLAPETLAAIRKDCAAFAATIRPGSTVLTHEDGGKVWRFRQAGQIRALPPLTPILSKDGKVRFQ